MTHRLAATLLAVVITLLSAAPAGAQHAVQTDNAGCRRPPPQGRPLPKGALPAPIIARLGLKGVWHDLSRGAGVTVAVVDTGVAAHPKLTPAVLPGIQLVTVHDARRFEVQPAAPIDCDNHGTMVAGLIAARPDPDDRVVGVAPEAAILPVRLADFKQSPALGDAIRLAARSGARVLNLSFALPDDRPDIRAAIEEAVRNDIVVVAAAGNEGQSSQPGQRWYPAAYDDVLAVAAVGPDGQPMAESNRGAWVDIAAPGTDLISTSTGGSGFATQSGTSFATALVSGVAALIRSRFPRISAAEVRVRLTGSAVPVSGTADDRVGAGVVDPHAALTYLPPTGVQRFADPRSVRLAPLPEPDPVLSADQATALAWSGGVVLLGALALIGGSVLRRAAARGWVAGPTATRTPADTEPAPTPPKTVLR
ncbi:MAG: type VII secretion-associated serine protease mycosin [Pseudonocardiaceae bacterium]